MSQSNIFPCKKCITLAICKNKIRTTFDRLNKQTSDKTFRYMSHNVDIRYYLIRELEVQCSLLEDYNNNVESISKVISKEINVLLNNGMKAIKDYVKRVQEPYK